MSAVPGRMIRGASEGDQQGRGVTLGGKGKGTPKQGIV